jgi:hypothetical protein
MISTIPAQFDVAAYSSLRLPSVSQRMWILMKLSSAQPLRNFNLKKTNRYEKFNINPCTRNGRDHKIITCRFCIYSQIEVIIVIKNHDLCWI